MNRSLLEIGGGVLVVSQFTLYGDVPPRPPPILHRGRRAELAKALYEDVVKELRASGLTVATGIFQADMKVELDQRWPGDPAARQQQGVLTGMSATLPMDTPVSSAPEARGRPPRGRRAPAGLHAARWPSSAKARSCCSASMWIRWRDLPLTWSDPCARVACRRDRHRPADRRGPGRDGLHPDARSFPSGDQFARCDVCIAK